MMNKRKLLVATRNQGKVREFSEMLAGRDVAWIGLEDIGITHEVEETGHTFIENANLKAQQYALMGRQLTLADDSGLEVDVLDGAPGVRTARYGGVQLSSTERYELLLENMRGIDPSKRTARFHCAISLADADGQLLGVVEGICEGQIALAPAGEGGFGYDPVFILPELGRTMAQLTSIEKRQISHRGAALRAIAPLLERVLA